MPLYQDKGIVFISPYKIYKNIHGRNDFYNKI
ncbi:Uncharacterised protein [Elizabethkingia anophelis]|nr:Uncharacterised protein [Elizabethkingia anophelis]